jgi:hypothetical protein
MNFGVDAAPSRQRRKFDAATIVFTPLVTVLMVFGSAVAVAHLVSGTGVEAALVLLIGGSIAMSSVAVLAGCLCRYSAGLQAYTALTFLLARGDDLTRVFPRRERSTTELVEEPLAFVDRFARDTLEDVRRHPGRWTRRLSSMLAVFIESTLVVGVVRQWDPESAPSLLLVAVAAASVCVFAIAWSDLAAGRQRDWMRPWRLNFWARGYEPERVESLVPSLPLLTISAIPYVIGIMSRPRRACQRLCVSWRSGLCSSRWSRRGSGRTTSTARPCERANALHHPCRLWWHGF